jgi:4-alpha-glucanotransferase
MSSVANLAIISFQDVLGLDENARMNRPSSIRGNWQWRLHPAQITPQISKKLAKLTQITGRW